MNNIWQDALPLDSPSAFALPAPVGFRLVSAFGAGSGPHLGHMWEGAICRTSVRPLRGGHCARASSEVRGRPLPESRDAVGVADRARPAHPGGWMPSGLYRRYVERFLQLKRAVEEGNIEALRRLELGLSDLPSEDMQAASMAIHDISAHLPMREFPHFQVTVQDPVLPCLCAAPGRPVPGRLRP